MGLFLEISLGHFLAYAYTYYVGVTSIGMVNETFLLTQAVQDFIFKNVESIVYSFSN